MHQSGEKRFNGPTMEEVQKKRLSEQSAHCPSLVAKLIDKVRRSISHLVSDDGSQEQPGQAMGATHSPMPCTGKKPSQTGAQSRRHG